MVSMTDRLPCPRSGLEAFGHWRRTTALAGQGDVSWAKKRWGDQAPLMVFDLAGAIFADVADGDGFSALGCRHVPKVYRRRATPATKFPVIDLPFFSAGSIRSVDAARAAAYNPSEVFARGVRTDGRRGLRTHPWDLIRFTPVWGSEAPPVPAHRLPLLPQT